MHSWDVLQRPVFEDIRGVFNGWSEEDFRELDNKECLGSLSSKWDTYCEGLQALELKPLLEVYKVIHLHNVGIDETGAAVTPALEYRLRNGHDLDRLLSARGAAGLCTPEAPSRPIMEFDDIVNGTEYYLDICTYSTVTKLQQASDEDEGFQDNSQVNKAIPGLFKRENLTLVQQPFKQAGGVYDCKIGGFFCDLTKQIVVLVEEKSGNMTLSDEPGERLAAMSYRELRELKDRRGYADAQVMATILAIRESNSRELDYFKNLTYIPVLASWHLSPQDQERAVRKEGYFRFVVPDGSGCTLQ